MSAINFKTSECRFGYSFSEWKEGPLEAYVRDQDEESYWTVKRDGVEVATGTASYDEEDEQNHFAICEQQATIAILLEKLKQKEEKLSELTHGIPIEKAKECGDYYCLDLGYCVATYFENGKWYYSDDGPNRNPCEVSNRLFPLPSTDTNGGYVND